MGGPFVRVGFVVLLLVETLCAQSPCAGQHARSLVMGGGGSKGAFEAGAAYHLIVHRGCDFVEFSGTSVGALNGAVLAQAARGSNSENSLANMKGQAEALIAMWRSIKSSNQVLKNRPLGTLRFGLFGLEAMKDFAPLRRLLAANVNLERLGGGRELRVATVSFHDGRYREYVLNANGESDPRTLDLLLASTAIPMFATMPRIADQESGDRVQFGDGGLRHNAPATSFFLHCTAGISPSRCRAAGNNGFPPHPRLEQLFVVTTNPYQPGVETTPVWDSSAFKRGTHQITDGRKVMSRAVNILMESAYHVDLDSIQLANDVLMWRRAAQAAVPGDTGSDTFPLQSYNYDPQQPDVPSRPYEIGIVAPEVGDAGVEDVLSFTPERIAKQMYCSCVAADGMMHARFGLDSMQNQCRESFYPQGGNEAVPDCSSRLVEPLWRAVVQERGRNSGAK